MKSGRLNLRISLKRLEKLKIYAQTKEKTVTQLVEDWIDRLPSPKIDDFDALLRDAKSERKDATRTLSTNPLPNQPDG